MSYSKDFFSEMLHRTDGIWRWEKYSALHASCFVIYQPNIVGHLTGSHLWKDFLRLMYVLSFNHRRSIVKLLLYCGIQAIDPTQPSISPSFPLSQLFSYCYHYLCHFPLFTYLLEPIKQFVERRGGGMDLTPKQALPHCTQNTHTPSIHMYALS